MNFDTILHLSCEHAMPIYRAALQVKAARHIVAVAPEYASFYEQRQCCLPEETHLEKVNVRTNEPDYDNGAFEDPAIYEGAFETTNARIDEVLSPDISGRSSPGLSEPTD